MPVVLLAQLNKHGPYILDSVSVKVDDNEHDDTLDKNIKCLVNVEVAESFLDIPGEH